VADFAVTYSNFVPDATISSVQMDQNFADIEDQFNLEADRYRDVAQQTSLRTAIGSTANFAAPMGVAATLLSAAASSAAIVYLNPSDYAVTGRTNYARLVTWSQTETAPTSSTLTTALYPVSSTAAGVITVGSVVSGSSTTTAAITGANTRTLSTSNDFAFPSANYYVVVFTHSVNPAQTLTYGWKLQQRAQ
jgi:hypothetical protein